MADVSVRPARPGDAAAIAGVQLVTWRAAYADLLPADALDLPEAELAQRWEAAAASPPSDRHQVLVAVEGPDVVGFAVREPSAEDPDCGELAALVVLPSHGRRGHGSRLLAATTAGWQQEGTTLACCWAWERDQVTRSFLVGAGWALDGATRSLDTGARVERQVRLHTGLAPD